MIGVGGKQLQECRSRVGRITHRNVQFIRSYDPEPWIAELPPELVPDGSDFDSPGGLGSVLYSMDHPGRG